MCTFHKWCKFVQCLQQSTETGLESVCGSYHESGSYSPGRRIFPPDCSLVATAFRRPRSKISHGGCCVWATFSCVFSWSSCIWPQSPGLVWIKCTRQTRCWWKGGGWVVLWQKWLCLRFLCSKFYYIRVKQGVGGLDRQLVWTRPQKMTI